MRIKNYLFIIIVLSVILFSCKKESFVTGAEIKVSFSADTIIFDTLFTEIGSATYYFKVYNNSNKTAKFDEIYLAKGINSVYRTRIDGQSGNRAIDVEIAAKDSMYIFIETTLEKNSQNTPQLISDSIIFKSDNYTKDVDIMCWGQNVKMLKSQIIKSETWSNTIPYLVLGNITVDTLETLKIAEGTRIYFHKDSKLTIKGGLISSGTTENPIIFSSDRLEEFYNNIPGQWEGIFVNENNLGVNINNTIIEKSTTGLSVKKPYLERKIIVENTKIKHCLKNGIEIFSGNFFGSNLLLIDCGESLLYFSEGTTASVNQSTLANYYEYGRNNNSVILFSNDPTIANNATFTNSIIFGTFNNEIYLDNNSTSIVILDHCLIQQKLENLPSNYTITNTENKDPLFYDINKRYFYLSEKSPAVNAGKLEYGMNTPNDLLGTSRITDNKPDLGAYEYFEIP